MQEFTYIDLVSMLYSDVESDECMPSGDRNDILHLLDRLSAKIEKYSG